jgi:hypothetical protein
MECPEITTKPVRKRLKLLGLHKKKGFESTDLNNELPINPLQSQFKTKFAIKDFLLSFIPCRH